MSIKLHRRDTECISYSLGIGKMKSFLVFLTILGLSLGAPKPHGLVHHSVVHRSLADDWAELLDLLPLEDIQAIVENHIQDDGAFAAVIIYLQGSEWADLVDEVNSKPEVQDFIQYLTDAGLPVEDLIAALHDAIANAVPGTDPDPEGSLRPLLDELEAVLPVDKLLAFVTDKLQNDVDFQNLYLKISSPDAKALVEEVRAIPEVQRIAQRLRDYGVKVDEALAAIYAFLGWGEPVIKFAPKSLADDWAELLALLPLDDIQAIVESHIQDDGAFAAVIIYLQGSEWADLVDEVNSKPEVQDFIQYLTDAGLPVEDLIAAIHDTIANAVPGTDPDPEGSLRPILDELEAVLPVDKLLAFVTDKLQNDPDFQDLYLKISSSDAKALVEEVRAIPEVQRIAQRLRDYGVKVDEALAAIYAFLGWGEPVIKFAPKSLADDWAELLDLLPLDDIQAIVESHIQDDGAFAAVIIYLQGSEWADLVDEVNSKPEVQDFIQYLTDAGLPVEDLIAAIHDTIANAVPGTDPDPEGSLRPLLDELEAVLPVDKLLAFVTDKLQNDPDFQDLYLKISSPDAKALVEEVRAIPEVQRIAQRLRDYGVKVDEALAAIYAFLGWGEPKIQL